MYLFLRRGCLLLPVLAAAVRLAAGEVPPGPPAPGLRPFSTDRPDQTESPFTLDAGHWQVESDLLVETHDHDRSGGSDVRTTDLSFGTLNVKFGLTSRMDLQFIINPYERSQEDDRLARTTTQVAGLGDIATRLKVNLWGNDGGPTAFAIMPFIKWPLPSSGIRNGHTEGGVIFILGGELPAGWSAAAMTEVDFVRTDTNRRSIEWINSVSFSRDLTARWGGYLELYTVMSDAPGYKWQGQFDAGLTYAVSDNTQVDFGCNFGITESAPDYQPFVGLSLRF